MRDSELSSSGPKEKCAVFAIRGTRNASSLAHLSLFSLQHRGEESNKIVSSDGTRFYEHGGMGLVSDVFRHDFDFRDLPGRMAIGHDRYSTHGSSTIENIQPLCMHCRRGNVAIAHNGTFVNSDPLRRSYENEGCGFTTSIDTEVVLHGIARSRKRKVEKAVAEALEPVEGSYAIAIMTDDAMIAARDPRGFKPLSIGKKGNSWVIASETCAFDQIGARYWRDVEPGEIVVFDNGGIRSISPFPKMDHSFCIFEFIYFARPDSYIFYDNNVCAVREVQGKQLAKEHPVDADVVIGIPNCATDHARGYARESGIELGKGFAQNYYVGRTFIQPHQALRALLAELKLNVVKKDVKGKRVVVVDDSIVRGTTSKKRMRLLRRAGAKQIHLRIACPPHRFGCYYGIDFPTPDELAANVYTKAKLRSELGVDSLEYLSLSGLLSCMPVSPEIYCVSCFDGSFPAGKPKNLDGYRKR